MDIKFVPLQEGNRNQWNEFCWISKDAWFRHTTYFMDYVNNCRWEHKADNLSFFVYLNGEAIAIAPLMVQPIYNNWEFNEYAIYDANIPFPAFKEVKQNVSKKDISKAIFEYIDGMTNGYNVAYGRFFIDPLTDQILHPQTNYFSFTSFGYTDYPVSSNILSLNHGEDDILREMRKGHKADVKYALKSNYSVDIYGSDNITREIFMIFKEIHLLDSGRQTRPDESWENMFEWVNRNNAILFLEKIPGVDQYVSGAIVLTYKNKAFYGYAATMPGFEGIRALGHYIQWEIIKELKRKKIDYYDVGWHYSQGFSQKIASAKEAHISRYKAGFGGQIFPVFRGEKVYDKDYFIKLYQEKIDKFCEVNFHA